MIIPLGEGLELTEDKMRVPPGTLLDCLNYEIAYSSGYRRIDGFLRFDGQPEGADLEEYRSAVRAVPNGPAYGLHFFPDWARDTATLYAIVESTRFTIVDRSTELAPALYGGRGQRAEIYNESVGPTGIPNAWILEPQANFGTEPADHIEVLTDTSLSTGAVVAYTRVDISDGQNVPGIGDVIRTDNFPPDWQGVVQGVEILSGTGLPGSPYRMTLWVRNVDSSVLAVGVDLVDGGGVNRIGRVDSRSGESRVGNLVGRVTSRTPRTDGASGVILASTARGWEPIESAYEARFIAGEVEPANLYMGVNNQAPAVAADYTALVGQTRTSIAPGVQRSWVASDGTLAQSVAQDDAEYAVAEIEDSGERTEELLLARFEIFTDPLDKVTGMTVEVVAEYTGDGDAELVGVSSSTGATRGVGTPLGSKQTYTFGGPNDLWGAISSEEFAAALPSVFGPLSGDTSGLNITLSAKSTNGTYPSEVRVYHVRVIIHKRGSDVDSQVYLRSGATDYPARVLYTYTDTGEWDGTAEGIMTFARLQNPSLVPANAEVRSEPNGGGVLLARLDSKVSPIRLPSRERLNQKGARFQFINTNFFAAGRLAAAYGVSGAGPAFTFNSQYLFYIRTGRTEDEPRHVARHADRLALGYENGDADFSVTGRPDLYDGTLEAYSLGFGQRITGMLPLTGGALGVWTEDSTHIVKGSASTEVQQQIISPTSGAIEYTVVDMGIPVFCDYRGINTLVASQKFGDFDMGRLSAPIRSWLLPRLTALRSDGQSRPILAQPVQKKNQYRLWFADGQILTMTFLDDQQAKFTFQKWNVNGETAKVVAATNGLDRELSSVGFASFEGTSFAYRLDHTDSFDGEPIESSLTLNPISATGPGRYERINIGHLHGIADGEFEFRTQIGTDLAAPSGHITVSTFKKPPFAKFRHKARGRNFTLKLDTTGAPQHTLQVIEFPDISQRVLER